MPEEVAGVEGDSEVAVSVIMTVWAVQRLVGVLVGFLMSVVMVVARVAVMSVLVVVLTDEEVVFTEAETDDWVLKDDQAEHGEQEGTGF